MKLQILFVLHCVYGNLIGIDLGSEFTKVSYVSSTRGFEILLNDRSARKTPTALSLNLPRDFGDDAINRLIKKPSGVYQMLTPYLEYNATKSELLFDNAYRSEITKRDEEIDVFFIKTHNDTYVSIEELLSHLFSHIKTEVNSRVATGPVECVIAIPLWAGQRQRRAIQDAAEIAGLKVLGLITQNSAAAVQHAMDLDYYRKRNVTQEKNGVEKKETKNDENQKDGNMNNEKQVKNEADVQKSNDGAEKKEKNHKYKDLLKIIVNIGAYTTQACVVQFSEAGANKSIPLVEVLGCSYRTPIEGGGLAGYLADIGIADKLISEFVKQNKLSLDDFSLKSRMRLLKVAKDTKMTLSANKEVSVYRDDISPHMELKIKVTRSMIEQSFSAMLGDNGTPEEIVYKTVENILNESIQACGKDVKNIHGIELIGGGWRMPVISAAFNEYSNAYGIAVGHRLNGDESIAMGSAYIAANHSATFKVSPIWLYEISNQQYTVILLPKVTSEDRQLSIEEYKENRAEETGREYPIYPILKGKKVIIIPRGSKLHVQRTLSIRANRDLEIKLFENERLLAVYGVSGVAELHKSLVYYRQKIRQVNETEAAEYSTVIKLSLLFDVNNSGIITLIQGQGSYSEPFIQEKKHNDVDKVINNTTSTVIEYNNTNNLTDTGIPNEQSNNKIEQNVNRTETFNRWQLDYKPMTKKVLIKYLEEGKPQSLSHALKNEATVRLKEYEARDSNYYTREKAKNMLETTVYTARDLLGTNEGMKVTSKEVQDALLKDLGEVEAWLYEDGQDAAKELLEEKNSMIVIQMEKIAYRARELHWRLNIGDEITNSMNTMASMLEKINNTRYWIPHNVSYPIFESINATKVWYEEISNKQKQLELTVDPILKSEDVLKRLSALGKEIESLNKIKKPAEPSENMVDIKNDAKEELSVGSKSNLTKEGGDVIESKVNVTEPVISISTETAATDTKQTIESLTNASATKETISIEKDETKLSETEKSDEL